MKPVRYTHLATLVNTKPILILNKTALAANFIDTVVRRSPNNIATTQGGKRLPLELWLDILGFASCDPNSHEYCLVQPQSIEQGILVCTLVGQERRVRCGELESSHSVAQYEYFLANPDPLDPEQPFDTQAFPAADDKHLVKVPTATLGSTIKTLFMDVTVPDIISWLEYGACWVCGGSRELCPRLICTGEWIQDFVPGISRDCGTISLCPLCIGLHVAETHLMQYDSDEEEDSMSTEESKAWYSGRIAELGD